MFRQLVNRLGGAARSVSGAVTSNAGALAASGRLSLSASGAVSPVSMLGASQARFFAHRNLCKSGSGALSMAKAANAQMADFRFTDMYGQWHHISLHIDEVSEDIFENGIGFDGSSIRGWKEINESDMILLPEATTARMDPFFKHPTVVFICKVLEPSANNALYDRDPRNIAAKSIDYLRSTGVAHDCRIGPEAEFFVFNDLRYSTDMHNMFFKVDSPEGHWNAGGQSPSLGNTNRLKGGYFPCPPADSLQDLRTEMVLEMVKLGIHVEASHHEVGGGGQCEIDMRFGELLEMGDLIQWYKYVVKNVARRHDQLATFMPKPLNADNGSGMHSHISLHATDGANLFTGDGPAGLSEMALHFTGGLIKHAQAVCAFSNPTLNSYKRLVPGFEAPINMAYSARNRSAAIRIPISHPKARRLEFRTPDPSCNPYLCFSAMLMAGLDGIQNKLHPGEPLDRDIYSLSRHELANLPKAPTSLEQAMDALEHDHEFLTRGGVFTESFIHTWIERKRELEIDVSRKLPTPFDFETYHDC